MICSISGEIAQDPVVSKLSGHIYESRLIKKAIQDNGKCPITGKPLTDDDLIGLQVTKIVPPRTSTALSIPGLLNALQNEWDETMLETFQLKQSLDQTRQQLAQALYQNDAACRVIARLMKERDEALNQVQSIQLRLTTTSMTNNDNSDAMETSDEVDTSLQSADIKGSQLLPQEIISHVNEFNKSISADRKARKPSLTLASKDNLSKLTTIASYTPHKAGKGGVSAIALSPDSSKLVSGSQDKDVLVLDIATGKVLMKLSGHDKKITDVTYHPDAAREMILSSSADHTIKLWNQSELTATFNKHQDEVTSVSIHPLGEYFVSGSLDGHWNLWNTSTSTLLRSIPAIKNEIGKISVTRFHPDGLIVGTGILNHEMKLWDIREQIPAALLPHTDTSVLSFSFNENGYVCATAASDGNIRVWDLRKLKILSTIPALKESPAQAVQYDYSGTYLAHPVEGSDGKIGISVSVIKEYSNLLQTSQLEHSKEITGLVWGKDASILISSSLDRTIKVHGFNKSNE